MTRHFLAHAKLTNAFRLRPLPESRGEVSLLPHLAAETTLAVRGVKKRENRGGSRRLLKLRLRLRFPVDGFDHEVERRPVGDPRLGQRRPRGSRRRFVAAEVGCVTASASANLGAVEPEPHPLGAHLGAKLGPNQLAYLRARARGLRRVDDGGSGL